MNPLRPVFQVALTRESHMAFQLSPQVLGCVTQRFGAARAVNLSEVPPKPPALLLIED